MLVAFIAAPDLNGQLKMSFRDYVGGQDTVAPNEVVDIQVEVRDGVITRYEVVSSHADSDIAGLTDNFTGSFPSGSFGDFVISFRAGFQDDVAGGVSLNTVQALRIRPNNGVGIESAEEGGYPINSILWRDRLSQFEAVVFAADLGTAANVETLSFAELESASDSFATDVSTGIVEHGFENVIIADLNQTEVDFGLAGDTSDGTATAPVVSHNMAAVDGSMGYDYTLAAASDASGQIYVRAADNVSPPTSQGFAIESLTLNVTFGTDYIGILPVQDSVSGTETIDITFTDGQWVSGNTYTLVLTSFLGDVVTQNISAEMQSGSGSAVIPVELNGDRGDWTISIESNSGSTVFEAVVTGAQFTNNLTMLLSDTPGGGSNIVLLPDEFIDILIEIRDGDVVTYEVISDIADTDVTSLNDHFEGSFPPGSYADLVVRVRPVEAADVTPNAVPFEVQGWLINDGDGIGIETAFDIGGGEGRISQNEGVVFEVDLDTGARAVDRFSFAQIESSNDRFQAVDASGNVLNSSGFESVVVGDLNLLESDLGLAGDTSGATATPALVAHDLAAIDGTGGVDLTLEAASDASGQIYVRAADNVSPSQSEGFSIESLTFELDFAPALTIAPDVTAVTGIQVVLATVVDQAFDPGNTYILRREDQLGNVVTQNITTQMVGGSGTAVIPLVLSDRRGNITLSVEGSFTSEAFDTTILGAQFTNDLGIIIGEASQVTGTAGRASSGDQLIVDVLVSDGEATATVTGGNVFTGGNFDPAQLLAGNFPPGSNGSFRIVFRPAEVGDDDSITDADNRLYHTNKFGFGSTGKKQIKFGSGIVAEVDLSTAVAVESLTFTEIIVGDDSGATTEDIWVRDLDGNSTTGYAPNLDAFGGTPTEFTAGFVSPGGAPGNFTLNSGESGDLLFSHQDPANTTDWSLWGLTLTVVWQPAIVVSPNVTSIDGEQTVTFTVSDPQYEGGGTYTVTATPVAGDPVVLDITSLMDSGTLGVAVFDLDLNGDNGDYSVLVEGTNTVSVASPVIIAGAQFSNEVEVEVGQPVGPDVDLAVGEAITYDIIIKDGEVNIIDATGQVTDVDILDDAFSGNFPPNRDAFVTVTVRPATSENAANIDPDNDDNLVLDGGKGFGITNGEIDYDEAVLFEVDLSTAIGVKSFSFSRIDSNAGDGEVAVYDLNGTEVNVGGSGSGLGNPTKFHDLAALDGVFGIDFTLETASDSSGAIFVRPASTTTGGSFGLWSWGFSIDFDETITFQPDKLVAFGNDTLNIEVKDPNWTGAESYTVIVTAADGATTGLDITAQITAGNGSANVAVPVDGGVGPLVVSLEEDSDPLDAVPFFVRAPLPEIGEFAFADPDDPLVSTGETVAYLFTTPGVTPGNDFSIRPTTGVNLSYTIDLGAGATTPNTVVRVVSSVNGEIFSTSSTDATNGLEIDADDPNTVDTTYTLIVNNGNGEVSSNIAALVDAPLMINHFSVNGSVVGDEDFIPYVLDMEGDLDAFAGQAIVLEVSTDDVSFFPVTGWGASGNITPPQQDGGSGIFGRYGAVWVNDLDPDGPVGSIPVTNLLAALGLSSNVVDPLTVYIRVVGTNPVGSVEAKRIFEIVDGTFITYRGVWQAENGLDANGGWQNSIIKTDSALSLPLLDGATFGAVTTPGTTFTAALEGGDDLWRVDVGNGKDIGANSGNITIAFWADLPAPTASQNVLFKVGGAGGLGGFSLIYQNDTVTMYQAEGASTNVGVPQTISTGWHHFALVVDDVTLIPGDAGESMYLYIDGVLVDTLVMVDTDDRLTGTPPATFPNLAGGFAGSVEDDDPEPFAGQVNNLVIVNEQFDESQIEGLYLPFVAEAGIRIIAVSYDSGTNTVSITAETVAATTYHVQSATTVDGTYTAVAGSETVAAGTETVFDIVVDTGVDPKQFFKVVEGPIVP